MKIKTKLTGFLILISIIPIMIVTHFLMNAAKNNFIEQEFSHFTTTAELKKQDINIWTNHLKLDFLATIEQAKEYLTPYEKEESESKEEAKTEMETFLKWILKHHPIFSDFIILETDTGSVCLSSDPKEIRKIYKDESFFENGKNGLFLQGITFSSSLGTSTMWIAAPVRTEEKEPRWVMAAQVNLQDLFTIMENASGLGKTGETYLVNEHNQLVGKSRFLPEQRFINVYSDGAEDCLKKTNGQGQYLDYREVPVLGVYRWIDNLNLCLLAEIDEAEVFAPFNRLKTAVSLAVLGLIIVLYSFSIKFTNKFMKPIHKLTQIASDIAGGNLKRRMPQKMISVKDEISVLAQTFNKMSGKLADALTSTQNIISTMPSALFIINQKGEIIRTNKKAEELLKSTETELRGKNFFKLFRAVSNRKTLKISDLTPQMKFTDLPGRLGMASQTKIPVSLSGIAINKKNNKTGPRFILTAADLREQKRYARSRVNKITPVLNRISLGDFDAKLEHPKSNDEFSDLIVAINLMTDNLKRLIEENRRKTDQLVKSHATLQKAKAATDREKAKAEALLSHIGEAVIAINMEGEVIFINPQAETAFGHRSSSVIGKPYTKPYHFEIEDGQRMTPGEDLVSTCTKKKKPIHFTSYFISKLKKRIPFSTTISPIIINGKLIGIVGTFRDISAEIAVDKAKSEFVSLASHQMRTPMTNIKWTIQAAMQQGNLNEKQKDFLQDALTSNERMIQLVDDLLNISRVDSGSVAFEPIRENLSELIKDLLREHRADLKRKNQKFVLHKPENDIIFFFDPLLVSEIVSNLISNAINYSAEGKTITVSLKKSTKTVAITVEDKGIGISKKDQKKLFTKFFRSSEASQYSTTSSGLGLYLVKQILKVIGGNIRLKSKHGKGSAFTVILPLKPPTGKAGKPLIKKMPS